MRLTSDTVVAREAARRAAILAVDKARLGDMLSDALVWTHGNGGTDGKASYLRRLGEKARFTRMAPTSEHVSVFGDTAIVKSEFDMAVLPAGGTEIPLRTYGLACWTVERDGVLRLTHFQSGTFP